MDLAGPMDTVVVGMDVAYLFGELLIARTAVAFARRSSFTSRSSSAIRAASPLVVPDTVSSPVSARLTQPHRASGRTSSWSAIRLIAPARPDACGPRPPDASHARAVRRGTYAEQP